MVAWVGNNIFKHATFGYIFCNRITYLKLNTFQNVWAMIQIYNALVCQMNKVQKGQVDKLMV